MSEIDPPPERAHAGVVKRLVAYVIDSLVFSLVAGLAYLLIFGALLLEQTKFLVLGIFLSAAVVLVTTILILMGIARKGQTPGKKAMGLVIIDARAEKHIGIGRAILRQFLLGLLGPINAVVLLFTKARRGVHDMAAGSIVYEGGPIIPKRAKALPPLPSEGRVFAAPVPPSSPDAPLSLATSSPPPAPAGPGHAPATPGPEASPVPPASGLVTPPPGMTPSPPPAAPSTPSPYAPPPRESASAQDHTRAARPVTWALEPVGEVPRPLEGQVLIGRQPDATAVPGAEQWAIDDPKLSVSKTHALVGLDREGAWIEDWDSTNGVTLNRNGVESVLPPRTRTPLRPDDDLLLGEYRLRVRRNA